MDNRGLRDDPEGPRNKTVRRWEESNMKLIFAVIRDKDANDAMEHLSERHIGVTKLASTGGFLRDGNHPSNIPFGARSTWWTGLKNY